MSVTTLGNRIGKLEGTDSGLGFTAELRAACERQRERERAWRAAGNIGQPPLPHLLSPSPNASRARHRTWRLIAEGRARLIHMGGVQPSPFRKLSDIYSMSDTDILRAVNAHTGAAA